MVLANVKVKELTRKPTIPYDYTDDRISIQGNVLIFFVGGKNINRRGYLSNPFEPVKVIIRHLGWLFYFSSVPRTHELLILA